jgi:serine/threonine protein kinase
MALQDANQSIVTVEEFKGKKALFKSVLHPRIPLLRDIEWWMFGREIRALNKLQPVAEVPDFLGFPAPYTFAMEFKEGKTLREADIDGLSPSFFERLESAVSKIHSLNIVHSDLKRKENIMVGPEEEPVLIDFGAAFRYKKGLHPINNWFFNQFKQIDLNAVAKYKKRYCPEIISEKEKKRMGNPVLLEKISRFGRRYILFRE